MAITKEELTNLLKIKTEVEKITTLSSDGKNLLSRIPKEICENLELEKGDKLRWMIDHKNKLSIQIIKK